MLHAFYNFFTKHCLSCQDAARLVSESCERKLTLWERIRVKMLEWMCPFTCRYAKQVRELHHRAPELEEVDAHASAIGMSDTCRERLKRELASAQTEPPN
ncbi:MAG: hypothetical protein ACFB21_16725 [Opitutales bacterium]